MTMKHPARLRSYEIVPKQFGSDGGNIEAAEFSPP